MAQVPGMLYGCHCAIKKPSVCSNSAHAGFSTDAYSVVLPMKTPAVYRRCWGTQHQQQGCGRQLPYFCMLAVAGKPRVGFRVLCSEIQGPLFLWEEAQLHHA